MSLSNKRGGIICVIYILLILICNNAFGAIKMPAIFGDNMVLQRGIKVPVWGWAKPGENIQIMFQKKTFKTVTDDKGKWFVKLGSYKEGGPYIMTISTGDKSLTIQNILVGDVWLASGQSNMEYGIQLERKGKEAIAKATDTLIHFFSVPVSFSLIPRDDVAATSVDSPNGRWVVCSPAIMANPKWAYHGFSAAGYYFAQQIRQKTGSPVGMIGACVGGTPAQNWISIDGLQQQPAFTNYVSKHQQLVDHYDDAKVAYPQLLATYKEALAKWNEEVGKDYYPLKKQWDADVLQARKSGLALLPAPKPLRPIPGSPVTPEGGFRSPSTLYNGMIAPVVPFGIKGVIWYQGESNGDNLPDAVEYKSLFPRLIQDWRNDWQQGDFPFLFVQIANYRDRAKTPSEGNWPWVREAQLNALSLPQTGMAVIIDLGVAENIHPTNKQDVGLRLALAARKVAYGEKLVYSGPVYQDMKIEGNKIRIRFSNNGSGLQGVLEGQNSSAIQGFGIAGEDHEFKWAKAIIDGNSIIVSADEVASPIAVRYNWADNPFGNLYNKDGLPASPFRTDDWLPLLKVVK